MSDESQVDVRPGFRCTCYYHAPEQHGPKGCTSWTIMKGQCPCKWDGKGDPDERVKEGER